MNNFRGLFLLNKRDGSPKKSRDGSENNGEAWASTAALNREVGRRKSAEARLLESRKSFQELFANNPIPMWVFDRKSGTILELNNAATSAYGYSREEFLLMQFTHLLAPAERSYFQEMLTVGPDVLGIRRSWTHQLRNSETTTVQMSVHAVEFFGRRAMLALAENTRELDALEVQLRQAQKMEAVGRLAGGIAHDFNNLLTVICGYSEMLLHETVSNDPAHDSLGEIVKAGQRAVALTSQLLAFSRRQVVQLRLLDLNSLVLQSKVMLQRLIGENIEICTHLQPDIGQIRADGNQIEQVILNISVNARDAMPGGGSLTIETENVDLGREYARQHIGVAPGRYVRLSISDTGCGMSPGTQAHIFEPFFTTKAVGAGTGLGLSMAYGIIKKHHGNIWVYTEPNLGSTFKIYLPVVDGSVKAQNDAKSILPKALGSGTVLLVEDDAAVRKLLLQMLSELGYTVLSAHDHETAIHISREHKGPIHLLLADVVIPGNSGPEIAKRVSIMRPEIKILFMSGYTDEALGHRGILDSGVDFLEKPCSSEMLAGRISEILRRDAAGQSAAERQGSATPNWVVEQ